MIDDIVSERVIGACMEVHTQLGPGLLESVYEECVCYELQLRGIEFARQVVVPVRYKGLDLDSYYRLDLVVDSRIIVELKSVELILPVHIAQLSTYLRATNLEVALLINFNVSRLKHGVRRFTKSADNSFRSPADLPDSKLL